MPKATCPKQTTIKNLRINETTNRFTIVIINGVFEYPNFRHETSACFCINTKRNDAQKTPQFQLALAVPPEDKYADINPRNWPFFGNKCRVREGIIVPSETRIETSYKYRIVGWSENFDIIEFEFRCLFSRGQILFAYLHFSLSNIFRKNGER